MRRAENKLTRSAIDAGDWHVVELPSFASGKVHSPAIGLIELSTEVVTHSEIKAFLPQSDAGIYTSRIEFGDAADINGLSSMEAHLSSATGLLPAGDFLDAVVYACTSGTMVIGAERVRSIIGSLRPGIPVYDPISAVISGLAAMNRRRIAVVTPYVRETNSVVARYLAQSGIEVVNAVTFDLLSGAAMNRLSPRDIYYAGIRADTPEAEAVFISCTGIRVSPILDDLEKALGKPVLSSNQALTWQCCETVGLRRNDGRGGSLFDFRCQRRD